MSAAGVLSIALIAVVVVLGVVLIVSVLRDGD